MKKINLVGQKFGRLLVLTEAAPTKQHSTRWLCRCSCGAEKTISGDHLRRGHINSCGCLSHELAAERLRTHGQSDSPEYNAWSAAKNRCTNTKDKNYSAYGGRGIKMCARWLHSFENFLADMGQRPSPAHSLDRVNNDGHYKPSNCRWATPKEQVGNQRPRLRRDSALKLFPTRELILELDKRFAGLGAF